MGGASPTRLIVPAYWEPEGSPNPWDTLCSEAPAGSIDIANPDNGPGQAKLTGYAEAVTYCNAHAQKVIGYVYTEYGKRSLSTVETQIADYYSRYPGIAGIFLDEMAEQPDEAYYAALDSYVHARGGIVVGNPGETVSTTWQLKDVDIVVTFEGAANEYASYRPASWVSSTAPERIANIVFGSSSLSCPLTGKAGYVYDTNLKEPNPYGSLPSYWATEFELC